MLVNMGYEEFVMTQEELFHCTMRGIISLYKRQLGKV
jgi:hypothetical protein